MRERETPELMERNTHEFIVPLACILHKFSPFSSPRKRKRKRRNGEAHK